MTTYTVSNDEECGVALTAISGRKRPFTITVESGRRRSTAQNKTQRLWLREIAEQLGDRTPEEVRGMAKLEFGVPILCMEDEAFRKEYTLMIQPLTYEARVKLMMQPFDFGVTRKMNTRQKTEYLDRLSRWAAEQGCELTEPMKG